LGDVEKATTTDESGAFTFGNLEPGTYPIFVQRLGYESAAKSVDVQAGAATAVSIELLKLRVADPFTLTYSQDGLVGCGVSVRPVVGVAVCGVLGIQPVVNTSQYDMFLLRWELPEPTEPWMTVIFETYWQSSQTLGRGLSVNWEIEDCPNNNDVTFADQTGQSPLYSYVDKDRIDEVIQNAADGEGCGNSAERCNEEFCRIYSRTFATAETTGQAVDVGVVFQQRYSQIVTAFYHEEAPQDYSALPDA
jgi:hypothetical protein